jgi:hypothetical protein
MSRKDDIERFSNPIEWAFVELLLEPSKREIRSLTEKLTLLSKAKDRGVEEAPDLAKMLLEKDLRELARLIEQIYGSSAS